MILRKMTLTSKFQENEDLLFVYLGNVDTNIENYQSDDVHNDSVLPSFFREKSLFFFCCTQFIKWVFLWMITILTDPSSPDITIEQYLTDVFCKIGRN